MKSLFIFFGIIFGFTLINSCNKACEGIVCEYDGICDNGECICTKLTANYLIGTWEIVTLQSKVGTFKEDNTFIDSFGNVVTWNVNSATNSITLSSNSTIIVKDDGFSCNQMNVTIINSLGTNDWTFKRL